MPTGRIVKDGFVLIGAMFILAIIIWNVASSSILRFLAIIPFVLACFFLYFFRNPKRTIPKGENLILSPADGKVMDISEVYEDLFLNRKVKKVTIFLSVFDVHVNRAPIEGEITFRQYTCGGFLPAYKKEVGFENERHTICIDNGKIEVLVTQIAGLLARRIISWTDLGSHLEKGQLYGMIKFGSCTEICMPTDVEILVKKGQHISGGDTVIGRLPSHE
ncbi:phosphatidylserine decarboxylase [Veillonella montpellierensis DNF00314]|uniref:Phosphatidylserine decarboxylase proenzyme n=1 Tax=Veillonella montpellierensis DNF00314 TaxID=1401067 RepID=A0A096BYU7_9FIRM|nr:phosphatidylserine decarboxylase family protein [Veillonella montpellierensis]KGF47922.1 phosphatidylserine decarboxylase [Veillonella montpellierensis DNF00314]